jgi:hypothetical protein
MGPRICRRQGGREVAGREVAAGVRGRGLVGWCRGGLGAGFGVGRWLVSIPRIWGLGIWGLGLKP